MNRPTSVTVIAILQLVFGGLCGILTICGGAMQATGFSDKMNQQNQGLGNNEQLQVQKDLQKKMEDAQPSKILSLGGPMVITLMMILSGIGLLSMQTWARTLALLYGGVHIAFILFNTAFYFLVTMPAITKAFESIKIANEQQRTIYESMKIMLVVGGLMQLIVLIYPIIVLTLMSRPKVAAAFRGESFALPNENMGGDADDRWGR